MPMIVLKWLIYFLNKLKLGIVKSGKVNSLLRLDAYDCFAMVKTVQTNRLKLGFVKSGKGNSLVR
jgi:hypothetical protein